MDILKTKSLMRKNKSPILFLLFAFIFIAGCYYDNLEDLYPGVDFDVLNDTTTVTFSGTIQPMLNTFCWECHSNANATLQGKGIFLENYSDIKSAADDGSLYGAVSWAPFYTRMPQDANKLSDIKIAQINKWVNNGAPND